jgi:hypothetical protein
MRLRRPGRDGPPVDEDPVVRQYRYLLRTAPLDALEAVHAEALAILGTEARGDVLGAVQRGLVAGQRLSPDDVGPIAHLLTVGERREPNAFLRVCPPASLGALARAALGADAAFGLFNGYAGWDGADPEPEDDSLWRDGGFNPDSGRWNPDRHVSIDWSTSGGGPGAGGGGDGGGGV